MVIVHSVLLNVCDRYILTVEFVLPKIERRSRPPPPYELHRHSKMASHGLPCPPYGMVARSQNIESSQVRSSTAVGGSETKRLSSRSLSPVKSTTTAHGSVTDDESVTSLHRAARLVYGWYSL